MLSTAPLYIRSLIKDWPLYLLGLSFLMHCMMESTSHLCFFRIRYDLGGFDSSVSGVSGSCSSLAKCVWSAPVFASTVPPSVLNILQKSLGERTRRLSISLISVSPLDILFYIACLDIVLSCFRRACSRGVVPNFFIFLIYRLVYLIFLNSDPWFNFFQILDSVLPICDFFSG